MSDAAITLELELYNSEPLVLFHAVKLRRAGAVRFKTLAVMARVFLFVLATQTKSERLRSIFGHILEDGRSQLFTHVIELTLLCENL